MHLSFSHPTRLFQWQQLVPLAVPCGFSRQRFSQEMSFGVILPYVLGNELFEISVHVIWIIIFPLFLTNHSLI